MQQRQFIVPTQRKHQNNKQFDQGLYGDDISESTDIDDITSLLTKRLKVDSDDDNIESFQKMKRNCLIDEKFIMTISNASIFSLDNGLPNRNEAKKLIKTNRNRKGVERLSNLNTQIEFKTVVIDEINYLEYTNFGCTQAKHIQKQKKKNDERVTKSIQKL